MSAMNQVRLKLEMCNSQPSAKNYAARMVKIYTI